MQGSVVTHLARVMGGSVRERVVAGWVGLAEGRERDLAVVTGAVGRGWVATGKAARGMGRGEGGRAEKGREAAGLRVWRGK